MSIVTEDSRLHATLKEVFGFSAFREHQELAVRSIIENKDTLMLLPTGGGKSLCYQLPAIIKEGVTVVVSPLLALMYDQVSALKVMGIKAESLSSMQSEAEVQRIQRELIEQKIKLLYVSPERMATKGFIEFLQHLKINTFVIDEAHCISEWGHEFRDDYRKLSSIRSTFPHVCIAAFTATATQKVKSDIINQLHLNDPVLIKAAAFRSNITIRAKNREGNGQKQLLALIRQKQGESGIVYAFSRKETEEVSRFLNANGIVSRAYHAGMSSDERTSVHKAFMDDTLQIVVATVAFGMGIDKSNIRFVIHTSMPKSIENYYQEIGRAGRDGLEAQTLLLYSMSDVVNRKSLIEKNDGGSEYKRVALQQLNDSIRFASGEVCRHKGIAAYFGDKIDDCVGVCDNCLEAGSFQIVDISVESQKFLSALHKTGQSFGTHYVIDVLRGSESQKVLSVQHDKLSVYGIGRDRSKQEWLSIANRLIEIEALFQADFGVLKITEKGVAILKGEQRVTIKETTLYPPKVVIKSETPHNKEMQTPEFEVLRGVRSHLAHEEKVPAYVIFSDKTLLEMSQKLPETKEGMLAISGIGIVKYDKYGEQFLDVCRALSKEKAGV
ncbi:MAG: DNA helicase RecQ [Sulfuricurvum sp.]|uniref:DNA helicase RecQ n=1 Tax=Sulfuricurvum sp. TaxID=2025608 RepID=UPI00272830F9|nr:DNA helicase RecQ [Sulfuricurvum sp.]MDO9056228.1 DNA helicase RecQ [Sulfuricurvum sp.]